MKKFLLINLLFVFGWSQVATDYAYTGAQATALAGAVAAQPGGESSLFHNPAGLAELENGFFTVGRSAIAGVPYSYAGVLLTSSPVGVLGITLQQSETTVSNVSLSTEQALGLTGGLYLQQDRNSSLSVGYAVNLFRWSLGRTAGPSGDGSDGLPAAKGSAVGVDVGVMAVLRQKHRIGVFIKNANTPSMGQGTSRQQLPRRINVALAYLPYEGLVTAVEMEKPVSGTIQIRSGIEYTLNSQWTLRVGVQSKPNRMGAGFSLNLNRFHLDYGLLTHPVLPLTHQITFRLDLHK